MPPREVQITSRAEWRQWLADHHEEPEGAIVVTFKKAYPLHVPYEDLVEEAICFGWIDSVTKGVDAERSGLYFSPRKPRTGWSRPNKERVARLEAAGLLTPAGLAKIEEAKADGSWAKLDDVENLVVPDDLARALDALPPARIHWDAFPRSVRRGVLEWILNAKKPETRLRRVTETAEMAQRNERANQWSGRA